MLGFVGLDEEGEEVYRLLVGLGAASGEELAHKLALPGEAVARALAGLERLGLVAVSPTLPGQHVAAPPAVALGAVLSARRHELKQAELAVESLAQEYRRNAVGLGPNDLVEPVVGADAVRHRFEQLQLGAERELLALVTHSPMVVSGRDNNAEPAAVARGVNYRVVIERAALDAPGGLPVVTAALERNEQVRVADRVPTKLLVADRSLAMVPLRPLAAPGGEPSTLVVRAGGLLESLVGLFESVWAQALPLRLSHSHSLSHNPEGSADPARSAGPSGSADGTGPAEATVVVEAGDQPDGVDLQILSMLLVGMTDASVAKQLDLGLRTVQRRVKRLMDIASVTTRMQLGWHAFERGWVART
ncbi:helix-turn-helix transcriptional regulator [Streptacidiphilus sp. EB129]|uniref:helix-turn-helix transcriptional regulator n=1 Tax=Streptacidiphilus sp. EB129 TaxID=3156262 RepID=UPI0035141DEA